MLTVLSKEDIALFKDREVDLLIESYSNATRVLQIRGFTENAQIIADHTTNADRSLASSTVSVTGIPTMLTIRSATTGVKRGACYVKIFLRIEGIIAGLLVSSYIADTQPGQWPGGIVENSTDGPGLIRSITGTDPAAGSEISETVPTGARWNLKSFMATLVTDATVANRIFNFLITDGTTANFRNQANTAQTASDGRIYVVAPAAYQLVGTAGVTAMVSPINIILPAGYKITSITGAMVAGDNWGAPQLLVEEWIEP